MNVLYEFDFDIMTFLPCFIPLIIGFICVFNRKFIRRSPKILSVIFSVIGVFIIATGAIIMAAYFAEYNKCKDALQTNQVEVVEGEVEQFHAMPVGGHDDEHFVINGVEFHYSSYRVTNGYCTPKCEGGVIDGNGQKLRIKYITDDSLSTKQNIILYIEQLE